MDKKLLVNYLVLLLLFLSGCSNHSAENEMKVITLKIMNDNPADSNNVWAERSTVICSFIQSEKPDIIGMQAVLRDQHENFDSVLTDYLSVGVGSDDGAREGEMNPLFYRKERFDFVRAKDFWLSETPDIPGSSGYGAAVPQIVTWTELVDKSNHQHVFFFNTHFSDLPDSVNILISKALLNEVGIISDGYPMIVTGDFNMLPSSQGYGIITGPDESVPLLKDSYAISERKPSGPLNTLNEFSDNPGGGRVDYIFVRNGMKVTEHRTIVKKEQGVYISDHWPVEAIVSLANSN